MVIKHLFQSVFITLIITALALWLLNVTNAQIRSSNNYQLHSDSVNVGGGYSSSSSYVQESTVGEVATGDSDSSNYQLRAGYQQMQEVFISLAVSGDVGMSPSIPGLTGGTANGSTTLTVTTDSPSGYQVDIVAEADPAMQRDGGSESIDDYDAGAEPDFSFNTSASDAHLGFSPQGVDVVQSFLDDGSSNCNTGSQNTNLACWDGLSTSAIVLAEGVGANHPAGATTTLNFRVGVGSGAGVIEGMYTATTTVTALPL